MRGAAHTGMTSLSIRIQMLYKNDVIISFLNKENKINPKDQQDNNI